MTQSTTPAALDSWFRKLHSQSTVSRKARLAFPPEGRSCRVYRSNDR